MRVLQLACIPSCTTTCLSEAIPVTAHTQWTAGVPVHAWRCAPPSASASPAAPPPPPPFPSPARKPPPCSGNQLVPLLDGLRYGEPVCKGISRRLLGGSP